MDRPDEFAPTDHDESPAADSQGIGGSAASEGVPEFSAARQHLLVELIRFVAILRREGVSVPASGALDAARSLAVVGLDDKRRVSTALRASLLSETDDADAFEAAFPEFWQRMRSGFDRIATAHDGPAAGDEGSEDPSEATDAEKSSTEAGRLPDADAPPTDETGDGDVSVKIPTERRHVSDDRPTETDGSESRRYSAAGESHLVEAQPTVPDDVAALDRFVDALGVLPGRRRRRAHRGSTIDARSALRESLETGGAPLELPYTAPTETELRCCLLVDVSGSVLDTIDRGALLALAERLTSRARSTRVFFFDTDLVEATAAFTNGDAGDDPAAALRAAEIQWGGGTRIGRAFESLRRTHPNAVDRRTIVVVVSDGLDVGEAELLTDGITWLSDRSKAIVWLNPLAASSAFEPQSRGMSTVEPYVDALFGFGTAADLRDAARQMERFSPTGSVGYEHDHRRTNRGWSDV